MGGPAPGKAEKFQFLTGWTMVRGAKWNLRLMVSWTPEPLLNGGHLSRAQCGSQNKDPRGKSCSLS